MYSAEVPDSTCAQLGGELTQHAARLIRWLRRDLPQPAGIRVLSILDETDALGITRLAALDGCSQPTMSGIVSGLVDRGWVGKGPDPHDARASVVTLTAEGRTVLARARTENGSAVAARIAAHPDLTEAELRTAVEVLRAVLEPPTTQGDR